MTESEAVEGLGILNNGLNEAFVNADKLSEALQIAIQALEEIQRFRAIGTVEECQEASDKQMPKKVKEDGYFGFIDYACPTCGYDAGSSGAKYCKNCGQKLRWR